MSAKDVYMKNNGGVVRAVQFDANKKIPLGSVVYVAAFYAGKLGGRDIYTFDQGTFYDAGIDGVFVKEVVE